MNRRVRSLSSAFLGLCVFALLVGCGGGGGGGNGGGGGGGGGTAITGVSPTNISALLSPTVTISGSGFGLPGGVSVTVIASAGTPFSGGTVGEISVAGTVVDDATITFTAPVAKLCPSAPVPVSVRVTLPGATPIDSVLGIATLLGPILGSSAPPTVPSGTATPISLNGSGYGPVGGGATVLFTATSGTPFQNGTSATATVPGTIASATSVNATSPTTASAVQFTATVTITFPDGSCASVAGLVTFSPNREPTLSTSVSGDLRIALGDQVAFTVTVGDPDGDPVSLRLLNPPEGCTLPKVTNATPPVTVPVEWTVEADDGGLRTLYFLARDSGGKTKSLEVRTRLSPFLQRSILLGDVTGDSKIDVVVAARSADVGGVANTGALYVWAGATSPSGTPTASLTVSGASGADSVPAGGFRLVDVTGDGTLDVVAASNLVNVGGVEDQGSIYVWKGGSGLTGAKTPDATLTPGSIGSFSYLAFHPLSWFVGDVSGDGVRDIVANARAADQGGTDTGGVYVWKGGSGLTGSKTPDATLTATSGAGPNANLALVDLTGDGVLDVFAGAYNADPGGVTDAGALLLWNGGSGLTGTKTPDATMTAATGTANATLGAQTIRFADVTNDGKKDVIAANPGATVSGAATAGQVLVWNGGSTLTGSKTQDATLTAAVPAAGDTLSGDEVLVGDVSGDFVPDIVAVGRNVDVGGTGNAGAAFLWKGGSGLTGTKTQDALLAVTSPAAEDNLGRGGSRLADVTNDGVLDVVCVAPFADVGGTSNVGAAYAWAGGSGLTGTVAPTAALTVPGAVADDRLGDEVTHGTFAVRFGDVSGDGALDVVVPAPLANVSSTQDCGAVYVWNGGSGLTGTPAPTATLTAASPSNGDRLGHPNAAYVALGDVSGDGVLDVLSGAGLADSASAADTGALYVWRGGAGLTGAKTQDAKLAVTGVFDDQFAGGITDGLSWDLADLTGDGKLDVVVLAPLTDATGMTNAGAAYLWAGGAGLSGTPAPTASLLQPNRGNGDALGRSTSADLLVFGDLTGDGTVDVLIGARMYTGTGSAEQGGVFLWAGSSSLSGTPAATTALLVPGAAVSDGLGY